MRGPLRLLGLSGALAALVSCSAVGPEFVRPEAGLPGAWSEALGQQDTTSAMLEAWWEVFDDPMLNGLVASALEHNNTLELAALRVLEARAQLGVATGARYPQTQVAAGSAAWVSPAENSGVRSNFEQYEAGVSIGWEVDFWGRYRRGIEAADAAWMASVAAYDQVRVLLVAAVVDAYAALRSIEEQLRIARENLVLQERSYQITQVLYRNGADSELDMQQANTLLLATRSTLPGLESSLQQVRNALSGLLGQAPGRIEERLSGGQGIPALPEQLAIGLPADLLRQRPDVRQAEWLARAQNARVGLAQADLYPSFSLSGTLGLAAGGPGGGSFGDLFSSDALAVSVGPSFVWPFLNYGRIRNNVRVQDARLQQSLVAYREAVLQAAREAEDALAAYHGALAQAAILEQTVASAKRSNELATLRYQEGFSDYQRVLDAQQALFTQQQRFVSSRGQAVSGLVALYKALGGGWQSRTESPAVSTDSQQEMQSRTDWGGMLKAAEPQGAGSSGNEQE